MKVLTICSGNSGQIAPFIAEQVDSLKDRLISDYFIVQGKGLKGYLKQFPLLKNKIKDFQPDIIHAHYGLSGLLANLQRKIPVVTTYHGSDINNEKAFRFSKWSISLSKHNIFVSKKNIEKAKVNSKFSFIPCGVDINLFKPMDKNECKKALSLNISKKYILFAGAFDNYVKNAPLAKSSVNHIPNAELIELKGYNREEVVTLMNAVDACLMTSFSEGSPQFIKEAMACNCAIVSTDVGDVKNVIDGANNCYIADYDDRDIAGKIEKIFNSEKQSNGREMILSSKLDMNSTADKIYSIYNQLIKK